MEQYLDEKVSIINQNKGQQIFKEHEEPKKQKTSKKSSLERFFDSAKGPKVFFEYENEPK